MGKLLLRALACSIFFTVAVQAAELETDWLYPVEGHQESSLGASVKAVEGAEGDGTTITIAIPKPALGGAENIEEIVVTGRKSDRSEQRLNIRHEWVADYDKDHYGLVLYLGKGGDIPLRLYLKSSD